MSDEMEEISRSLNEINISLSGINRTLKSFLQRRDVRTQDLYLLEGEAPEVSCMNPYCPACEDDVG